MSQSIEWALRLLYPAQIVKHGGDHGINHDRESARMARLRRIRRLALRGVAGELGAMLDEQDWPRALCDREALYDWLDKRAIWTREPGPEDLALDYLYDHHLIDHGSRLSRCPTCVGEG